MSQAVEVIKAITELIKAFFSGFGVVEAIVVVVVLALLVAIFRPEALAHSFEWLQGLIPLIAEKG